MNIRLETLKEILLFNLKSLENFEFTFFNPLFWAIIFILFFVLQKRWGIKNAFTFSAITAVILLLTTELEGAIVVTLSAAGEPFDSGIIRLISLTVISFLFLVYAFLR